MAKPLIIVESPAKARTIAGFLGADYAVASSVGHIRDLPSKAADIPAKYKNEPWARLAVNVDNDFEPLYVVNKDKRETVKQLKSLLKDASELYLATDEDREGESIAWHLTEVLKPKIPIRRMVFHEITPSAIREALEHPRDIDTQLVDAQEARRVLDRLYGYEVSPVLWKKVRPKLSAGRVQSVATRIIVERERERMAFAAASYWDLEGQFAKDGEGFGATLAQIDGVRVATGRDFGSSGTLSRDDVVRLDADQATALARALDGVDTEVRSVEAKPYTRKPYPPFRTSTLQQEAGRKLRFPSARTMSVAQRLYENGYITYMRTDSTSLSETALAAARTQISDLYGDDYLPDSPRLYSKKVKGAQEAHEAIRPAGDLFRTPDAVAAEVGGDEARLYELIWKRTVASQMKNATGESVSVRLGVRATDGRDTEFATSGKVIDFPGFLRAYVEGSDDPDAELDDQERRLPELNEGDPVDTTSIEPVGHETKAPARYTEASLVRRLEELGVGRPSTYASIISTIQARGYVWKKGSALVPSFTAFATVYLLETHFPDLVDYAFTARMESDLDRIADGEEEPTPWLHRFYFGDGGLKALVADDHLEQIDPREVNSLLIGTDVNDRTIVARVGQYGPYLQRDDDRASIPEDLAPDELTVEKATELLDAPSGDKILGTDADSGLTVLARAGRYGPYVQLGEPEEGSKKKPKTASLFKTMSLDDITLDQALELLTLPRVVGDHPDTEQQIQALNGRYGPYIKMDAETRSLETEEQLFTLTLDEAVSLLAQPKQRGRRAAAPPLNEFGEDPVSKKKVVLKKGRFGPYVTDGETNASLRQGDDPETITEERAFELLQIRRDRT
ncbi:MAG: type I DNA topoisomerase [Acidimicrobiia bacterium]|nr:type I DNA topoisomerase [Acidimicrobiia bacterium]